MFIPTGRYYTMPGGMNRAGITALMIGGVGIITGIPGTAIHLYTEILSSGRLSVITEAGVTLVRRTAMVEAITVTGMDGDGIDMIMNGMAITVADHLIVGISSPDRRRASAAGYKGAA